MADRSGLGWRVVTALVLAPAVIATVLLAPPWATLVLSALFGLFAAHEAFGCAFPPEGPGFDPLERHVGVDLTLLLMVGATLSAWWQPLALAGLVPALLLFVIVFLVLRPRDLPTFSTRAAWLVFVPIYVGTSLAVFPILRGNFPDGGRWVLLIMTLTFFADTAAYFAGRFLGRRKFHPRLSPKKTWEGAIGGMVGSVLAVALAKYWYIPRLEVVDLALLPLAAGSVGQIGDLFESALKRSVGIKDSGTLLPGHGGILDRIDALMPAALVTLAYGLVRGLLVPLGG